MADPKPFASLSSGLLARKGAARPAMRPQGFGQVGNGLEDLGWNDMGHEGQTPPDGPRDVSDDVFGEDIDGEPRIHHPTGLTPVQSPVHDQQAELAGRLGIDPEDEEFDETAELYDPNAVDPSEPDEQEEEGEELYEAPYEPPVTFDAPEKPRKQPLQLSSPTDEPSEIVVPEETFEPVDNFNGTVETTAADEPFELTERFDEFDPFEQTEEETDSAEADVPPPPPAQIYQPASGYQPVAPVFGRAQRAAPGSKAKAAFTLRLDPDRHLKLRLACAVNGRSAQQIVTDAVDQLLAEMPELDVMAEKAKRKG